VNFVGIPESNAGRRGKTIGLCTSYGGDPNFFCTGADERACALAGSGAGGHNVVDQQNFAAGDGDGFGNLERTTQSGTTLVRCQREERMRVFYARKSLRRVRERPCGREFLQAVQRSRCQQTSLVESAPALPCSEKRHRNYDKIVRGLLAQPQNRCGQPATEHLLSESAAAFKLQQVQQLAQLGVIRCKRNGARKFRRREAAEGTLYNTLRGGKAGGFQIERIATARALVFCLWGNAVKTRVANLAGAKVNLRSAAQAAIRRKEEVDKVFG